MTCFNEANMVRDSMNSLLSQLDKNYEVIVVDNFSRDGTYEVLREFAKAHSVKVIQRRCSRGMGRQFAFENASGDYIIANLDLDDVFLPVLNEVVTRYHERAEGKLLAIYNSSPPPVMTTGWVQNITIGPRNLIASLGGWRDLNLFEDWDIWSRAEKEHKYRWTSFRFAVNQTEHPETRTAIGRLTERYWRYRSRLRLGMRIFSRGEKTFLSQRLAYIGARLSLVFQGVLVGQDLGFKPLSPSFYVSLAAAKESNAPTTSGGAV
jgi:glycosyltransferase involved in cell wall biosynthesis